MRSRTIRATLSDLDISSNGLQKFPADLVNLKYLVRLDISDNKIKFLPFSMRKMYSLRHLNIENNLLQTIPDNLELLRLETLHLSRLPFCDKDEKLNKSLQNFHQVSTLLEAAAQVITRHGVPYSTLTIPSILCDFINQMPLCQCGKVVFSSPVTRNTRTFRPKSSPTITKDMGADIRVDSVFCSKTCFDKGVKSG